MISRLFCLLITLIMLTACVSTPTAPSVITLPGKGISFEQFRVDDYNCRMFAFQQLEGKAPQLVQHSSGTANGAAATGQGSVADTAQGGMPQPVPATTAMHRSQRQFDIHYIQCMYARGHRVPMLGRLTGDPADVEAGNPKINAPPSGSKPPVPPTGNPSSPPSR